MIQSVGIRGHGFAELWTPRTNLLAGPAGLVLKQRTEFENLVTEVGDEYYGETAVAKTGAGAAIVTLVASSLVAIDGSFPTSALSGSARRIQWKTTWNAGVATANDIAEVALVNQSTGTQTVAPAAATISRALLSPDVDKAAGDTLAVTWNHDLLGA
jgi:hypothetical protein